MVDIIKIHWTNKVIDNDFSQLNKDDIFKLEYLLDNNIDFELYIGKIKNRYAIHYIEDNKLIFNLLFQIPVIQNNRIIAVKDKILEIIYNHGDMSVSCKWNDIINDDVNIFNSLKIELNNLINAKIIVETYPIS